MPAEIRAIERAISSSSPTTGSFEDEIRDQLWQRCHLLFLTGLAISVLLAMVEIVLPSADPALLTGLSRFQWLFGPWVHAATFVVGLIALTVVKDRGSQLRTIAFVIIAVNIALVVAHQAMHRPATDPYFGFSLLIFLSAAFIPWRPAYQIGLTVLAAGGFLALQILLYVFVPEAETFWAGRGGAAAVRNHVLWGTTGLMVLGGASALVSSTLYSLRKTAHQARRLGKYIIHEEIAHGGMGEVYFAQHSLMCRPTAVKVMRHAGDDRETAFARFEREIRVSATLTHPNTITIYDVGRTPDRCLYYAMEYLEGLDLQDLVDKYGPVSPARTVYILKQVCGSLAEAHSRDIIHRDIKPSNIFLTRRGLIYDFVKVLDFGLAKQVNRDTASAITQSGVLFGTPRYIAPETVYGNEKVDGRADLYCVGCVAYWMLTGRPPFTAESSIEVVVDHVKTVPKRPSEVTELEIPPELDEIVMKLMQKKPDDRFQTAWEVEEALDAVPLSEQWSRHRAEAWWHLHGILGENPHDCECFFEDEEATAEPEPSLVAAEPTA